MLSPSVPLLLLLAASPLVGDAAGDGYAVAQLSIHQRIVIRIPATPGARAIPVPPTRWKEKHGPKCVAVRSLAGAIVNDDDEVDLILQGGARVRAHLDDDCPALRYYSGFYLKPQSDGQVCAKRDDIRSRSGGACRISSFRALVAKH